VELLEGIRPLLGSRVPTPNLLEEALASIMMDSRIKELLGRQVKISGAMGSSDGEQWQALFAALSSGLRAEPDQAVADYDEDGWKDPAYHSSEDVSILGRNT
jgi:hypothetical protein